MGAKEMPLRGICSFFLLSHSASFTEWRGVGDQGRKLRLRETLYESDRLTLNIVFLCQTSSISSVNGVGGRSPRVFLMFLKPLRYTMGRARWTRSFPRKTCRPLGGSVSTSGWGDAKEVAALVGGARRKGRSRMRLVVGWAERGVTFRGGQTGRVACEA